MPDSNEQSGERVLITGGTGFIGTALMSRLLERGGQVSVLTRNRHRALAHFSRRVSAYESMLAIPPEEAPQVIVNLAGKNLGEQRWNREVKQQLIASRVDTTRQVIDYIARTEMKPDC